MVKKQNNLQTETLTNQGLIQGEDGILRCFWVGNDKQYQAYHDEEWGIPSDSNQKIFEKICLEGFQAGLSWLTILRKRPAFRTAFAEFDYNFLANCNEEKYLATLMQNDKIIRHKGKISAVFNNARATIPLLKQYGSFTNYLYQFLPPATERYKDITLSNYQTQTLSPYSVQLSKDLKKRGFRFVGPTTAYAFMQAMGLVNDHIAGCSCHAKAQEAQKAFYT